MMNVYLTQLQFYSGVDLHTNNWVKAIYELRFDEI